MNFYCIGDVDTVRGFRLAGIAGQAVTTASETAAALDRACMEPGLGIIILTQARAAEIRQQVDFLRLEREHPLIVEIPGPEGPLAGRKSLRSLVQEAVGVKIEGEGG